MKTFLKHPILLSFLILLFGLFLGWLLFAPSQEQGSNLNHTDETLDQIWTCSMHPSIRQHEPGKCPICGMDLIPLGTAAEFSSGVIMSEATLKLAGVETMVVESAKMNKELQLNGKIQVDERLISTQTSHIPGRIEQLLVNFTGEPIQAGQTIARIYSPELVTAQKELLEAKSIQSSQPQLYLAAREKLKNWKLTDTQIDDILATGKPTEIFPIHSNFSGVILQKKINVGDHVLPGTSLYDIANLSRVWILFDVYEADLPWIKKNDEVEFKVAAYGDERFKGNISFIDPVINPATRVATARVEIQNNNSRFKPEMFVTGIVNHASASAGIAIPKSAVLWTGRRSIVYVKQATTEGITFNMHEVTLGPSLGDQYTILKGLDIGTEIVVNGAFTIDAATQLSGKPSMMRAEKVSQESKDEGMQTVTSETKEIAVFKKQLADLLGPYLKLKDALVDSDPVAASKASGAWKQSLSHVDMKALDHSTHQKWMPIYEGLEKEIGLITSATNVEVQRKHFSEATQYYFNALEEFKPGGLHAYYQYCPMAFNNLGAYWISAESTIRNPYFGAKMLTCGEIKEEIK